MTNQKQMYKSSQLPVSRRAIERQTGRILSMRTANPLPLATLRVKVNSQKRSILFKLPAEIREDIYKFVFAEFLYGQAYPQTAKWRRDGYEGPKKTDCKLLLTCRKIWLEAHHWPIKLATPTFWFWNGPRDLPRLKHAHAGEDAKEEALEVISASEKEYFEKFFKKLTPLNRTNINKVRIFASESFLGSLDLDSHFNQAWFATKLLTITIRQCDWLMSPRSGDQAWLEQMLTSPLLANVQQLKLELEMSTQENQKLEDIAQAWISLTSDQFPCNKIVAISGNGEEAVSTVTITWKSKTSTPVNQRHPKGYKIKDGVVEVFGGRPVLGKPQKRGGRRSQSVSYRNHWEPNSSSLKGAMALRDGKSYGLTMLWAEKGSLLCFV